MKYRILEVSNNRGKPTVYRVQKRCLWWWETVQVQEDFDRYEDAEYYSYERANQLKQQLEYESGTKYTKRVL
jgi:hypothetical protein